MFKHWFCWKYQYNKYMFNFIYNYSFIHVSSCVGRGSSALLCPRAYYAVKTALIRHICESMHASPITLETTQTIRPLCPIFLYSLKKINQGKAASMRQVYARLLWSSCYDAWTSFSKSTKARSIAISKHGTDYGPLSKFPFTNWQTTYAPLGERVGQQYKLRRGKRHHYPV